MLKLQTRVWALATLFALSAAANADITVGGARAQGMGGAGLALPIDIRQNFLMNPAFLAFGNKSVNIAWPQIGAQLRGFSVDDLNDIIKGTSGGGLSNDSVVELARRFGQDAKRATINANIGLFGGGLALSGRGEVGIRSIPNAALQAWNGQTNTLTGNERLDAYGTAYTSTDVGYGNTVRSGAGRLALGATARVIDGYFAHKIIDGNGIATGTGVTNGSGIAPGEDAVRQRGVAVDLGAIYSPPKMDNLYLGAVVENFVKPNIAFDVQSAGGGAFDEIRPFQTTLNLGAGYLLNRNIRFAADAIDIGNNNGRAETRYGAEWIFGKGFGIRAGYNSRTAFTYGIDLFGLNIQIGGNAPLTIASAIRF